VAKRTTAPGRFEFALAPLTYGQKPARLRRKLDPNLVFGVCANP
jgi:hypothetical protein